MPQSQPKIDAMEQANAQMQAAQTSLETTVNNLKTNVDKISLSVELIAKSQSDLQKKFETFMGTSHSAKQHQQADITALLHDAMHKHVYLQLKTLFNETNDRFAYLETLLERVAPTPGSLYESDSDKLTQTPMDTSTTTDVSGQWIILSDKVNTTAKACIPRASVQSCRYSR